MLRPRIRIPLWAAAAVPVVAYLFRALVLRGGDFTPDLPVDAFVFGMLAVAIALTAWTRRRASARTEHEVNDEGNGEGSESGKDGHQNQLAPRIDR